MSVENVLRKHVAIIHAFSPMSILQRKVVNVLLHEAIENNGVSNEESVATECRISFLKLIKKVRFNSNNTQYLKEAIDSLASIKIEWNLLKDKVPSNISFLNLRVLHGPPTFYQDQTVNFSFHKVMLSLLENPAIYGTLDLNLQSEFESKYSHALYENSTRFVNLHKNKVIQLDTLRKMLGVREDKYITMREFTRNVITNSLQEVNDLANFVVDLKSIKCGRKITAYDISVTNKNKPISTRNITDTSFVIINKIKQAFGQISSILLNKIMHSYSLEYIDNKINYTIQHTKKESNGYYPIRYFMSSLKNDYKESAKLEESRILPSQNNFKNTEKNSLEDLRLDLNHWSNLLIHAQSNNKIEQVTQIKLVIEECKKKISNHGKMISEDECLE